MYMPLILKENPKSKGLLLSGMSREEKQVVTTKAGQSFTCLLVVPVPSTRSHLTLGPAQSRPLPEGAHVISHRGGLMR